MRKLMAAVACGLACWSPGAMAGPATDTLGRCLVAKSNDADRLVLLRWIFIAMAASPKINDLAKVTDSQRYDNSRQIGALLQRLITTDCRTEAVAALREDGRNALKESFGKLGESAMDGLIGDPKVAAGLAAPVQFVDLDALADVMREAGMKVPPHKPAT